MMIHEVAHLTRRMAAEEYRRLVASISEDGQLYPILRANGQVIDGRHRLEACHELGIEPRFLDVDVPAEKLAEVALSANHIRKADSPAVRALDAARLTDLESEQGHPPAPGKLSIRAACKALQTTVTQVHRARMVIQHDRDGRMEAVIRAGLCALPQNENDFDGIEAMIGKAESTVSLGTVDQAEPVQPIAENPEFKRLAREAEQLRKDLRAARRRDRKDAENSEIARELAQTQAQLAEVQIKLAAVEAGPDAGVLELAKPKVIVERDPVVERELRETKNRLEQAEEAARRATADMEAMHKTMIKATEKSLALEGQLAKVQNTERVFELFGKQILQWRSDAGIVAASVRRNPHLIDLQVEAACKEVATKLVKIAETLADHRAAPSTAASVPAEVRQIAHA